MSPVYILVMWYLLVVALHVPWDSVVGLLVQVLLLAALVEFFHRRGWRLFRDFVDRHGR